MGRSHILYFLQVSYIDCVVQHITGSILQFNLIARCIFQAAVNMGNLIAAVAEALVCQRYSRLSSAQRRRSNRDAIAILNRFARLISLVIRRYSGDAGQVSELFRKADGQRIRTV